MQKFFRIGLLLSYITAICMPNIAFLQNDLLDVAFQPSKNLQHIINIWNNKNAVWNEIFRGSTDVDANLWLTNACYTVIPNKNASSCKWSFEKREGGKCYKVPQTETTSESACTNQWWEWRKLAYAKLTNDAPLLVRITQTLLRLTIALSIPVLLWIGVKVIRSWLSGGSIKDSIKEVSWVLIGLALALSAIGIIYLVQSIATNSLPLL